MRNDFSFKFKPSEIITGSKARIQEIDQRSKEIDSLKLNPLMTKFQRNKAFKDVVFKQINQTETREHRRPQKRRLLVYELYLKQGHNKTNWNALHQNSSKKPNRNIKIEKLTPNRSREYSSHHKKQSNKKMKWKVNKMKLLSKSNEEGIEEM